MVTRVGSVAYELQRLHFSRFQSAPSSWQPAINAYLCEDRLEICLDLAGVLADDVTIGVNERRLLIHGNRVSPEHLIEESDLTCRQILAMEIENGPFSRVLDLPVDVDPDGVSAEHRQGMLWIDLPVKRGK